MWKDVQVGIKWEKQAVLTAYLAARHFGFTLKQQNILENEAGNWQVEKCRWAQQVEGQANFVPNGSDCRLVKVVTL